MLNFTKAAMDVVKNSHTKQFQETYLRKVAAVGIENNVALFRGRSEKITLIVDVDHTLLSATRVSADLRVSDDVTFRGVHFTVAALTYDLKLRQQNGDALVTATQQCADNSQIPVKGTFTVFEITDPNGTKLNQTCQITQVKLVEMQLKHASGVFKLPVNDAIEWQMQMQGADLQHGFLRVRLRPGLGDFLQWASKRFHVVLFTAAARRVYDALLQRVHSLLCARLSSETRLWNQVFFRDDCTKHGRHYVKNIFEKGFLPSRALIADNCWLSFAGMEPNAVAVDSYYGAAEDCQLASKLKPILERVLRGKHADVRYALNGVQPSASLPGATQCQVELTRRFLHAWNSAA